MLLRLPNALKLCAVVATTFLAFSCWSAIVYAGSPPLIIDDPETPGAHGWEVNITSSIENSRDGTLIEAPLFDFNYGFVENDQLKVEFAVLSNDPSDDRDHWGISDVDVGYKYRFLEEKEFGWAVSTFPQLSCPTGNEQLGLGSGSTELLIPFELEKHFFNDKLWINPEAGYNIVFDNGAANHWKTGVAAGWLVTDKLQLEAEVGDFIFQNGAEPDQPFFNFGYVYDWRKHAALVGSAGRSFRSREDGVPDFFALARFPVHLGRRRGNGRRLQPR